MKAKVKAKGSEPRYIILLAILLGSQPVATDLYLPVLSAIAAELGNPALTLTGSLLAFGFAQLILDPLSDRYGQRPALLAGCAAYALTSFAGAWVSTLFWRVVCRCLQGAAMAALVVYGGAWRDFYDGRRVYQRFTAAVGDDRRTMPDRDFTRRESAVRTGGRYRRFP